MRSWTGSLLPTPLAADFGPGSGGRGGGLRSLTGSLLPTPLPADFGPNPEGAEEGCAGRLSLGEFGFSLHHRDDKQIFERSFNCVPGSLSTTASLNLFENQNQMSFQELRLLLKEPADISLCLQNMTILINR